MYLKKVNGPRAVTLPDGTVMTRAGLRGGGQPPDDRLQAERDTVEHIELPIPEAEICERFEKLYTGAVNDVLRELCLPLQALPPNIVPLSLRLPSRGTDMTTRSASASSRAPGGRMASAARAARPSGPGRPPRGRRGSRGRSGYRSRRSRA